MRWDYRQIWSIAISAGALLASLPAALPAQEAPGTGLDGRMLRLIIEQVGEDNFGAVDAKTVVAVATEALKKRNELPRDTVSKLLLARGLAHLDRKDFGSAKVDADELCKARPKDADARWLRAMVDFQLGDHNAALADAKAGIELQPKSGKMHSALAFVLYHTGDTQGGKRMAQKAIELDPKHAGGHYLLADFSEADPEGCVRAVDKYLELSQSVDGYHAQSAFAWKGLALCTLNRHRQAISPLLAAHKLDPKDTATIEQLAVAYLELGKFHLAAHYAEEYIRLDADRPGGYDRAARAYAKLGRMKEARAMVEKGVAIAEKSQQFLCQLAEVHAIIGEYEKARDYFDRAIARQPGHFRYYPMASKAELLATCPDAKIRDGKAAVELAEAALNGKGCPDWFKWRANMVLAEAHAECGDFDKAVEFAKEAIRLGGPDFARRQEFLDKLALFEKKMPYRMKPISD